jgi:hypothetical protein
LAENDVSITGLHSLLRQTEIYKQTRWQKQKEKARKSCEFLVLTKKIYTVMNLAKRKPSCLIQQLTTQKDWKIG